MTKYAIGIDFGTESGRAAIVDVVDEFFIGYGSIEADLARDKRQSLMELRGDRRRSYVGDAVAEMQWWACFSPPKQPPIAGTRQKKVGRNDPYPCGSGKKYKKCCGARH